jgi:D-glycero-alpha-D-manno-heptose-7-phosphate kinase
MIISMTPLRVSFFGGGTDYPDYFMEHGGAVLATAIDKYVYLMVSPLTRFSDHKFRISYSITELCHSVDEIKHPSVRECLRFMGIEGGLEINVASDLPARTGLGSSSSFTVGLLHALHAYKGQQVSPQQLAEEAVHVEQQMIKERVGCQDQFMAAYGGLTHLQFDKLAGVHASPVPIKAERLEELQARLMLFYTGVQRTAHEVLEVQIENTRLGRVESELKSMQGLVEKGLYKLGSNSDIDEFGKILDTSWQLKKSLSPQISNLLIDESYDSAIRAGAIGGKLLGAGGGGFLLLYVRKNAHEKVRLALKDLQEVQIRFAPHGSRLIFYQPTS